MKQLRFFEISKDDYEFLEKFQEVKSMQKEYLEIYHGFLKRKIEYLEILLRLKERISENIIQFDDIRETKEVCDVLEILEEAERVVPGYLDELEIWIEYNSDRASRIN